MRFADSATAVDKQFHRAEFQTPQAFHVSSLGFERTRVSPDLSAEMNSGERSAWPDHSGRSSRNPIDFDYADLALRLGQVSEP